MKKGGIYLISLIISIFLMLGAFFFNKKYHYSLSEISIKTAKNCNTKLTQCKKALALVFDSSIGQNQTQLYSYFDQEKIGIYLWTNDSLSFWNNAQIPLKQRPSFFPKEKGMVKLSHGYYLYLKEIREKSTAVALCLIKPLFELQNNYLKNNFSEWTGIPNDIKIDTSSRNKNTVVVDESAIFSLTGSEAHYYNKTADNLSFVLFFIGFMLFLILLVLKAKQDINALKMYVWIGLVLSLRFLMLELKWPSFFYQSDLYDLQLFGNAQSFLNGYLGDILLNSIVLLFTASLFHFRTPDSESKINKYLYICSLVVLIFITLNQFNQTAMSLITNSTLSFDFLSIFNIKFTAFIGLAALSAYSLAIFALVHKSISFFKTSRGTDILKFGLLYLGICALHQFSSGDPGFFQNYWLFMYALLLFVALKLYDSKTSLALGLQILIMSVVTSNFFNVYIDKNQQKDLDILSLKLSERQDAILESEFAGIPEKMALDEALNTLIGFLSDIPTAEKEIELLLKQKYFGGYFDRYKIEFSLFDKNCSPLLEVSQPVHVNEGFFEDQISANSDSTFVKGLFFVKNYKKNSQYIGKIKLRDKSLYVMMEPKQFEELGSFPDLLLDQSQQKPEKLKGFSHSVYRSQQLTTRYGEFNYPFFLQDSLALSKSDPNFIHHYFLPDGTTQVIISQKAKKWNYLFTFNSYLLLFFSLMTYASYILYSSIFTKHFANPSLTRRIQTIIIILLLLAMSAVGITSGNLVSKQFERDNKRQLEEKTQIIINELTGQFKSQQFFEYSQKELINLKLKEYARLFNTPISLFTKKGELFNTSESKLYDLGLAAAFVNPDAYWKLTNNQSSSVSVNEKAGTLNYFSLYTPLFDAKKELVGFINLPYFAKQSDLVNELSGIISALINVYVILFVISIFAGLILSGFITQPLRLIKLQLGNITLGKQNEKIVWQSNDEVGRLVSEYNLMLEKLEESANLLAQSEREGAWREMAKQVAHEIKNPLTPMKLNLQYLQHLMKNNPQDFKEKFERASAGIIEQIDSLANIATEFSNFAKLPGVQLQTINLVEVITSSVLIFENQKNVQIVNNISEEEILVRGDRDQCLRVFNNVLKNALQALEEKEHPLIEISYEKTASSLIISVKDNGCGIADDLKSKIFTPNFTTKTTGSGLGLAMVKNIMEGFNGSIGFESEKGNGTTFYLEFKLS